MPTYPRAQCRRANLRRATVSTAASRWGVARCAWDEQCFFFFHFRFTISFISFSLPFHPFPPASGVSALVGLLSRPRRHELRRPGAPSVHAAQDCHHVSQLSAFSHCVRSGAQGQGAVEGGGLLVGKRICVTIALTLHSLPGPCVREQLQRCRPHCAVAQAEKGDWENLGHCQRDNADLSCSPLLDLVVVEHRPIGPYARVLRAL